LLVWENNDLGIVDCIIADRALLELGVVDMALSKSTRIIILLVIDLLFFLLELIVGALCQASCFEG
jgi:Co/Zn/Cd efflux system component